MNQNPVLSICVVTMNRANQLKEALESCLKCELPQKTQFVIIDNASTDNTEHVATEFLNNCGYAYYYEKMQSNLGCGGGRNYAFSKANGEYVYVLDDDAVISKDNKDFFTRAIRYFEEDDKIVTLTTQIYDTVWKQNRVGSDEKEYKNGLRFCRMFCGGSHFLRRSFFTEPPYLSNKYGYEELMPSLFVYDAGKINAFAPELLIIHQPAVNKWDASNKKNQELIIDGIAVMYAVKRMMFPNIFLPMVVLAYIFRCRKHLKEFDNASKRSGKVVRETMQTYKINRRIKTKTVIELVKKFGISIF